MGQGCKREGVFKWCTQSLEQIRWKTLPYWKTESSKEMLVEN